MAVSREEVLEVAALARLRLEPEEVAGLAIELSRVLEHVQAIRVLEPGPAVAEASLAAAGAGLRDDQPGATLGRDQALAGAPAAAGDLFVVPRVVRGR